MPSGYVFSAPYQTNKIIDSNADQATGLSECESYTTNQSDRYVDAGMHLAGDNTPPVATITSPTDGASGDEGANVTLAGTATDTEDDDATLTINWSSDLDGDLGDGLNVDVVLSVGTHLITGTVVDSGGMSGSASVTFTVNPGNSAPVLTITDPLDGATFDEGNPVTLSATVTDNEDDDASLLISWSSDLDGALGDGSSIVATLSIGTHVVSASSTDSGGLTGSANISVIIQSTNVAPTVEITARADGATVNQLDAITFSGTASDIEDDDSSLIIDWSSDIDGALGTGSSVVSVLSPGTHTVTASTTDSENAVGTASISVTVVSTAPSVSISSPLDGASVTEGETFTLEAMATDGEDTNLVINWTSDIDGALGDGTSIVVTLSVGSHVVTASSTDSDGLTGSDTVSVSVNALITGAPNILVIIADDMGIDASSSYDVNGESKAPTPTLDSLASEGLVFDNVWSNPLCTPTRGTLLTGRYGYRTDVVSPSPPGNVLSGVYGVIQNYVASSAPEAYSQAVFGKWHVGGNGSGAAPHPFRLGIPEFRGIIGGGIPDYYNWTINNLDSSTETTTVYATTQITDFALDWLAEPAQQGAPWFLWMAYNAPHTPYQLPPNDLHDYDHLAPGNAPSGQELPYYQAMAQALDTEIGRLLNALDPAVRDNTVIIFLGDNGTPIDAAQSWTHEAKGTIYESGIRVPLIVSGRGVTRKNVREDALVVTSDLYATIAELVGIGVTQINDSFSFAGLLSDATADNNRTYAYTEICTRDLDSWAIRNDRYKLIENRLAPSERKRCVNGTLFGR